MAIIKGKKVTLISKIETGKDDFNRPIYEEKREDIDNVLISPVSSTEILNQLNLTGKKTIYQLAIPKGDNHIWENQKVEFWGRVWNVIEAPLEGMEELIPLDWNKKVMVESYE